MGGVGILLFSLLSSFLLSLLSTNLLELVGSSAHSPQKTQQQNTKQKRKVLQAAACLILIPHSRQLDRPGDREST